MVHVQSHGPIMGISFVFDQSTNQTTPVIRRLEFDERGLPHWKELGRYEPVIGSLTEAESASIAEAIFKSLEKEKSKARRRRPQWTAKIGDKVYIPGQRLSGEITKIEGQEVEVRTTFGFYTRVKTREVRKDRNAS